MNLEMAGRTGELESKLIDVENGLENGGYSYFSNSPERYLDCIPKPGVYDCFTPFPNERGFCSFLRNTDDKSGKLPSGSRAYLQMT